MSPSVPIFGISPLTNCASMLAANDDREPFARQILTVLEDKALTDSAKSVFSYLTTRQRGSNPKVLVYSSEIAEYLGLSKNTVTTSIQLLVRRGHILHSRVSKDGGNRYMNCFMLLYRRFGWNGAPWAERMRGSSSAPHGRKERDMRIYKALTLYQPHATLVAIGAKRIETRSVSTSYQGLLAIHAGRSREWLEMATREPFKSVLARAGYDSPFQLPLGDVVGICDLAGCFKMDERICRLNGRLQYGDMEVIMDDRERDFGNYAPGRYGYVLEGAVQLASPVRARGKQGFWNWEAPKGMEDNLL